MAEDDDCDFLFFVEALNNVSPLPEIKRVKNGLECLKVLKSGPLPDLIFLDLNMPYKSGLDCLKFIKDTAVFAEIPVLIYSTSHYIKDIDACYKNKAHYFIVKPADARFLVGILNTVFSRLAECPLQPRKENFVVRVAAAIEK